MASKIKFLIMIGLAIALSSSNLNYQTQPNSYSDNSNDFILKVENKANTLFCELKDFGIYDIRDKKSCKPIYDFSSMLSLCSSDDDQIISNYSFDLCEEEIKYLYNTLDSEAKNAVVEHLEDFPELEFFYKIGLGQDFSINEFVDNNPDIAEKINEFCEIVEDDYKEDGTKDASEENDIVSINPLKSSLTVDCPLPEFAFLGSLAMDVLKKILPSIIAAAETASNSIWIPFIGWAIAAIAVVTIVIIIACNWDAICKGFNALINYLCGKYPAISSLIEGAGNDARTEAWNNFKNSCYQKTVQALAEDGLPYYSENEMDNDLSLALKVGGFCKTIDGLKTFFNNKRPEVYLGKMESKYYDIAKKFSDGVCFYVPDNDIWNRLDSKYKNNAWPLNRYFLNLMISLDSIFYLCSAPNKYFRSTPDTIVRWNGTEFVLKAINKIERLDASPYAYELEHIYNCGYRWYSNIPIVKADHY